MSWTMAARICQAYPQINPQWLWKGENVPFVLSPSAAAPIAPESVPARLPEHWADRLCAAIQRRSEVIEAAVSIYGIDPLDALLPIIREWAAAEKEAEEKHHA